MLTPSLVIEALQNTNSRLGKEQIIQQAFDAGLWEFFEGAQLALDVLVTYGVKSVPLIEDDDGQGSYSWQEFKALAHDLQIRKLSGNAAREALRQAAMKAPAHDWNFWYRRILLKDLKCGTSEKTINIVLDKNGNQGKSLKVPVFSCQLAKPADDHPKKMTGPKLVDRKFDGCLSSEWVIEFEDGRRITIGEVVNNKIQGRIKSYNVHTKQIEFNEIEAWSTNRDMTDDPVKWFKLTLENGIKLPPLTGNHLVWLPQIRCWRRVDQLRPGDKLLQSSL
jgi:hypothetical protein